MQKRGYLEFIVVFVLFLLVSIPFSVADMFAEQDDIRVEYVESGFIEEGEFGRITGLAFKPDDIYEEGASLNLLPLAFFVVAGSVVLLSLNVNVLFLVLLLMVMPLQTVNAQPSAAVLNNLTITEVGENIRYFIDSAGVSFSFNITDEEGIDLAKTSANLTAFGMGSELATVCGAIVDNVTTCSWNSMTYNGDYADTVQISVNATNLLGNSTVFTRTLGQALTSDVSFSNLMILNIDHPLIGTGEDFKNVSWIASDSFRVNVKIDVNSTDIRVIDNSIKANFSELDNVGHLLDSLKTAACSGDSYSKSCSWFVDVHLNETKTPSIAFKAVDDSNTTGGVTLSEYTFHVDSVGPEILAIESDYKATDGSELLGKNENKITAKVREDGIGMAEADISLDLSSLGLSSVVFPDSCDMNISECYWEFDLQSQTLSESFEYEIKVNSNTVDLFGNTAVGVLAVNASYSRDVPVIGSDNIMIEITEGRDKFFAGDELVVEVRVRTELSVIGMADFSLVNEEAGSVPAVCSEDTDGYWLCEWDDIMITEEGPYQGEFYFYFTNAVGITAEAEKDVTVYGQVGGEPGETVDYWEHDVSCSPSKIDRSVTTLSNQRVYCAVRLDKGYAQGVTSLETESMSLGQCTGDTEYLVAGKPELINSLPESVEPYLLFTLKTADFTLDELNFECPVSIISLINGENVTAVPEIENVSVEIKFYDLPLGELKESVEEKIDSVKSDALVMFSLEDTFRQIFDFGSSVCGFLGTWQGITSLLSSVEIAIGLIPLGATRKVAQGLSKVTGWMNDENNVLMTTMYNTCKYVSCDITLWGGWYTGYKLGFPWDDLEAPERNEWMEVDWLKKGGYLEATIWPSSPKDSIVLSLATGCIPGIISGIHNYRQIKCQYALCLRDSGTNNLPIKACEDSQNYMFCKFVLGEVFQLIPLAKFFRGLTTQFSSLLKDPLGLIFGLYGLVCGFAFENPILHGECVLSFIIPQLAGVINDIKDSVIGITENENFFQSTPDVCRDLLGEEEGDLFG